MTSDFDTGTSSPIHVSGTVLTYAVVATVVVLLLGSAISLGFSFYSLERERHAHKEMLTAKDELSHTKDQLRICELSHVRTMGRLESFERMLIAPHRTAIQASVKEFKSSVGGEDMSLENYETWVGAQLSR